MTFKRWPRVNIKLSCLPKVWKPLSGFLFSESAIVEEMFDTVCMSSRSIAASAASDCGGGKLALNCSELVWKAKVC